MYYPDLFFFTFVPISLNKCILGGRKYTFSLMSQLTFFIQLQKIKRPLIHILLITTYAFEMNLQVKTSNNNNKYMLYIHTFYLRIINNKTNSLPPYSLRKVMVLKEITPSVIVLYLFVN